MALTPDPDRERLRRTFDDAAGAYDRSRPGYPAALFYDLAELAGIGAGARVLEIGLGTGQLTIPLAERGCQIVGIELGRELAAIARRKLARFPLVTVVTASFEDWPLPTQPFDAVVAATSFHWIDPAIRVVKAADALRPGGSLAIVGNDHVAGGSADFFEEVQACYEHWDPSTPPGLHLSEPADIPLDSEEVDGSGRFGPVVFRRHEWDATYSTSEYIDLLSTYSGHRALPADARDGLLACIADLIKSRHGGQITKRYQTELRIAHRRQEAVTSRRAAAAP